MKFVGNVFNENGEIRGKLSFILGNGSPDAVYFFKGFEDLKMILEKEYKKLNQKEINP